MKRLIPPSTKSKTILFLGLNSIDVLVGGACIGFMSLFILADIGETPKMLGVLASLTLMVICLMKLGNLRGYQFVYYFFLFLLRKKKMEDITLKEGCNVKFEGNIVSASMKSKIIEIHGIDFGILPERKQDAIIQKIGQIFKNIKQGKIIKIDKPIDFTPYIKNTQSKSEFWQAEANKALNKYEREGDMPDSEAFSYAARLEVLKNTEETLEYSQTINKQYLNTFYLVMFDYSEDNIKYTANQCVDYLNGCLVDSHILSDKEVREFYENYFDDYLDENEDFFLPNVTEKFNKLVVNGEKYKIITIDHLPLFCANAWLSQAFGIKGAKVVMNFNIEPNKQKVFKTINKTIINLQSQYIDKSTREDEKVDLATKLSGIQELLDQLKMDNELLHCVSVFIMVHEENVKEVEERLHDVNIYTDSLFFRQFDSYLSMMPYEYELASVNSFKYQWQTSTLAATFPFVTKAFMDPDGNYLGASDGHVFFDQFYSWKHRGEKRTSPNMVVMGKTGGGKSYFMKKLIMQHLCDNMKCFILDPENEYDYLATVFGGNIIDVGGVGSGIINPLQVFPTLKPDDSEGINGDSAAAIGEVSSHRQFLQEFFNIIMPKVENRCFVFLDEVIGRLYSNFGISDLSDVQKLAPEQFPTLEDLYDLLDKWTEDELNNEKSLEYNKVSLVILRNNLKAFKKGGVYSKLWNGKTTLELTNDFTVLNFQSLFSANNSVVANAQMLLVMRYLNQEVIKNKNNNELYGTDKNMVIAVDEAHQFINPRFPVALDFMAQMVKRIRKYGGGMIITTQNIADFIGQSDETKAKATAVIDGCQYTMVFGLNPNDVNNMIELYKKYNGGLTQNEIDLLTDAQQGEALFLVDSSTRMSIKIMLMDGEEEYIIRPKKNNEFEN